MDLAEAVGVLIEDRSGVVGLNARNLVSNETVAVGESGPMLAESAAKTFILVHYS